MQQPTPGGIALFLPLLFILPILLIPVARILRRTGHSRWWCLLGFIPFVNLIGLWVLAYVPWPAIDGDLTSEQR
jgi:uncharacterized membrane protein YhaH (DUF805 family)